MGKKIIAWFGTGIFFLIVLGVAMTPLEETPDAANVPSAVVSAAPSPVIRPEEEPETVQGSTAAEPAQTPVPVPTSVPTPVGAPEPEPVGTNYILNINSGKFHDPSCSSVNLMNENNKRFFTGTRDEVIAQGFVPCQRCNP